MSARKPAFWATYSGDVTDGLPIAAGPNCMGEWLYPVTANYDAETGKTRVGFSLIAPADINEQFLRQVDQHAAVTRFLEAVES